MVHTYTNFSAKVFCGFYDSPLWNCDMFYNLYGGETPKGWEFDFTHDGYEHYSNEMSSRWVDCMKSELALIDSNFVEIGEFKKMNSPREYNFRTDRLVFDVEFDEAKLKAYCFAENREDFDKYLNECWSSRDGFISFIPDSVRGFEWEYSHIDESNHEKGDLLDVMLEYYFRQNINFDYVEFDVLEYQREELEQNIALYKDGKGEGHDFYFDNDKEVYVAIEW